jgi:hypothetical protein
MNFLQQIYVPHLGVENLHVVKARVTLANQQQPEVVMLFLPTPDPRARGAALLRGRA